MDVADVVLWSFEPGWLQTVFHSLLQESDVLVSLVSGFLLVIEGMGHLSGRWKLEGLFAVVNVCLGATAHLKLILR